MAVLRQAGRAGRSAPGDVPGGELLRGELLRGELGELLVSEPGLAEAPGRAISGGTGLAALRSVADRGPASRLRRSRYDLNASHTV